MAQQLANLVIRGLRKVLYQRPTAEKSVGTRRQTDFVDFVLESGGTVSEAATGTATTMVFGTIVPNSPDCRAHGRARCQPIVNKNDHAIVKVEERTVAAILLKAPLQLDSFALGDRADDMRRNVVRRYDIAVEHFGAPAGDGAQGQLWLPRHAQLADDKHVERHLQLSRDFIAYRHASARKREHHHIVAVLVVGELSGQKLASLAAIVKSLHAIHLNC